MLETFERGLIPEVATLTGDCANQRWCVSHRADPAAAALADRHYSRQKIGSPQFAPAGSCAVFLSDCGRALWVTSFPDHARHQWAGAWINSAFRQEGAGEASELIRQAVAATVAHYGEAPPLGMITFIDRKKVAPTMVRGMKTWGYCYRKAGFVLAGETQVHRHLVFQLWPDAMPGSLPANPRTMHGTPLFDMAARPRIR